MGERNLRGRSPPARELFEEVDDALGQTPLSPHDSTGPESELTQHGERAAGADGRQPCRDAHSRARSRLPAGAERVRFVGGSLARRIHCPGSGRDVQASADVARLLKRRGQAMQQAVPALAREPWQHCSASSLKPRHWRWWRPPGKAGEVGAANDNAPGQVVDLRAPGRRSSALLPMAAENAASSKAVMLACQRTLFTAR